ncbi:unnamed protein product [Phytomonas sp. EM1]|nr:unnamed protein product [Phytomonas sp. EM1]|eukprot:CCW64604.1 unnamed protein product [Phytomonas sp. isolate EM1]
MPTSYTPGLVVHLNSSHPNERNLSTADKTVSAVTSLETLYSRGGIKNLGVATASCPGIPVPYDDKNISNNITTSAAKNHELDDPPSISRTTPLHTVLSSVNPSPPPRGLKLDKAAWRCGLCGYLMLSLDQEGNPIPFTCSAFGTPLPLGCPSCSQTHINWESANPFDALGAHINLRNAHRLKVGTEGLSQLPSSITCVTSPPDRASREATDPTDSPSEIGRVAPRTQVSPVATALHATFRSKSMNVSQMQCYYCGRCHRRLLRVDAWGELVPMNCDADGNVLPILCPGCGMLHSEWTIGPFR